MYGRNPTLVYSLAQERLLGEDGNPRKTKENEDPFHMGLVLEWVYGTIVSTAEKARDSAKKILGEQCGFPWGLLSAEGVYDTYQGACEILGAP